MSRLRWEVARGDQGQIVEVAACIASGVEWRRIYDRSDRSVEYQRRQAWSRADCVSADERELPPDLRGWEGPVSS